MRVCVQKESVSANGSSVAPGSGLSGSNPQTAKQSQLVAGANSATKPVAATSTHHKHAHGHAHAATHPSHPTPASGIGVPSDEEFRTAVLLSLIGIHEVKMKKRGATQDMQNKQQQQKAKNGHKEEKQATTTRGITEFESKAQYVTHTLLRVLAWVSARDAV